jgi:hypothetical protein
VPAKSQKAGFDVGSNIHLGVTNFSLAGVDRYVCAMCGYVEDWISSPEDLERIKKKFAS